MKYLADKFSTRVIGGYEEGDIENGSVIIATGQMLIDTPNIQLRSTPPAAPTLTDLVAAKTAQIQSGNSDMPNIVSSEFTVTPTYSVALSTGYAVGPLRTTRLLPGGILFVGPFSFGAQPVNYYSRWSSHGTSYAISANGIIPVTPVSPVVQSLTGIGADHVQMDITDSAGVVKQTMVQNSRSVAAVLPGPFPYGFYVKLTNTGSYTLTLGDFYLLWS